jgi:hypothetical protein
MKRSCLMCLALKAAYRIFFKKIVTNFGEQAKKHTEKRETSIEIGYTVKKENEMRHKGIVMFFSMVLLTLAAVIPGFANRGHGDLGVVYVASQGLYYDTFVSAQALPMHGRFQKLENGVTDFGPGDQGYVGGRWWIDNNGNNMQDEGDDFLLCPLLGPGRTTP